MSTWYTFPLAAVARAGFYNTRTSSASHASAAPSAFCIGHTTYDCSVVSRFSIFPSILQHVIGQCNVLGQANDCSAPLQLVRLDLSSSSLSRTYTVLLTPFRIHLPRVFQMDQRIHHSGPRPRPSGLSWTSGKPQVSPSPRRPVALVFPRWFTSRFELLASKIHSSTTVPLYLLALTWRDHLVSLVTDYEDCRGASATILADPGPICPCHVFTSLALHIHLV